MLRSSAQAAGYPLQLSSLIDPAVDPGIPGGRETLALVHAGLGVDVSAAPVSALAEIVGGEAAVEIAGVVANFEIMNRVVDGVGLPFGRERARGMRGDIELLGMAHWPHSPEHGS